MLYPALQPGIASTLTPLCGLKNLLTPFPIPVAHTTITNPLRTQATEKNQRQRQRKLQPLAVSTPRSVVSGSPSIHHFGHSDMTHHVFATHRLMERYMWNRQPFTSGSHLEMVSYAPQCAAKALAVARQWQIFGKYWNTDTQQNNTCSIPFEAYTEEILKEVF
jgi:hypothetical protein